MEFISLTSSLFILTLLSTAIVSAVIYNRFFPELFSRIRINKFFGSNLNSAHYQLIENIDIICADGQRLYIKQLLVSMYGLFIIDTCHYRGTIYGSHHQVKWLSKGLMHSIPFHNPHMDRHSVIEQLAKYLQISPKLCNVLVVFTGNSHFPTPAPSKTCKINNLIRTICQQRNILINPGLLPEIISSLKATPHNSHLGLNNIKGEI